jgi:non-specific serine/threonine protein kinase
MDTVADYLRARRVLLVLDNAEHLVEACAQLAETLLRSCPDLQILATSREALGIGGETAWRVPSLALPDARREPGLKGLTQFEAARLFIGRAEAALPSFAVTNENAPAVAEICRRLDGIPLAIELAAARVKALTVEQIQARLDDRFRLLTGGSRTALPRHRTLRAMIDWGYDLLAEPERKLLRRLAVFAGGWTFEAAEAICAGEGVGACDVLDLLPRLVDKSLVLAEERGKAVRYHMLETIRQYAREKLAESGEAEGVQSRHLDFFLELAKAAGPELEGARQGAWLERLEAEHDNLRAALRRSLEVGEAERSLRLAGALGHFWGRRGYLTEGREWLEAALAKGDRSPVASRREADARAKALRQAGWLATWQADYGRAKELHEEGLALSRSLVDKRGIARSLNSLGNVAWSEGSYPAARSLYEESLAIWRELGDKRGIAASLNNLGLVVSSQGDYGAARTLLEEGLAIRRELGDETGSGSLLNNLANVARHHGDYAAAHSLYVRGLSLYRGLTDRVLVLETLEGLAAVAAAKEQPRRAALIFGAVEAMREALGAPRPPSDRAEYDWIVEVVRAALVEGTFAAAWEQGRAMTLEQAIAYALEDPSTPRGRGPGRSGRERRASGSGRGATTSQRLRWRSGRRVLSLLAFLQ